MRIGSDAAQSFFGEMTIRFYLETLPDDDEEIEAMVEKLDELTGEIEETIRVFVALPNEFALVTDA